MKNRHTFMALLMIVSVLFPSGCNQRPDDYQRPLVVNRLQSFQYRIDDPSAFAQSILKRQASISSGLKKQDVFAIENADVDFVGQRHTLRVRCELVAIESYKVYGLESETVTIHINSQPMVLEDAYKVSMDLCSNVGIDDQKLRDWLALKKYESNVDANVFQKVRFENVSHSIDVRRSFDAMLPWRIVYATTFSENLPLEKRRATEQEQLQETD